MAMGRAVLRARLTDSPLALFAIWDGKGPSEPQKTAGTAVDLSLWHSLGHESWRAAPDGRPMSSPEWAPDRPSPPATGQRLNGAILFADVQGYGRLRESDLPSYATAILAPVARLLDNHETHVLTRNSWGDAIFAVFDDVAVAAECAAAIQQTIGSVNRDVLGYPFDLGVRLAGHYGPIRPDLRPDTRARDLCRYSGRTGSAHRACH